MRGQDFEFVSNIWVNDIRDYFFINLGQWATVEVNEQTVHCYLSPKIQSIEAAAEWLLQQGLITFA